MSSDKAIIVLRDVSFAYDHVPVLEHVDLTIMERELVAMVGPNGGGKTTLLKLILGLLRPDQGKVRVFSQPPERVRLRMGYVPQYVHYDPQFPVSVIDIVLMGRLGRPSRYGKLDREAAHEALHLVGMEEVADRPFEALSGGQRQRALIARALASESDLLLLDEPTANIDALVEAELFELLKEMNQRMTILMVSHDLALVSSIVKRAICVNRQVAMHPTSDITDGDMQQMYGGDLRMVRHDLSCFEQEHTHG
jgi:zinc transport system ATP-binding protein